MLRDKLTKSATGVTRALPYLFCLRGPGAYAFFCHKPPLIATKRVEQGFNHPMAFVRVESERFYFPDSAKAFVYRVQTRLSTMKVIRVYTWDLVLHSLFKAGLYQA
jgi:hypothetical protein